MAAPGGGGPLPAHSNLYVRGFPPSYCDSEILSLFSPFGAINSLRVVAASEGQAPHAFVKFEASEQAAAAIHALNGSTVGGSQLVVKFADADVQPRVESGRQPSEWCYCRNLPPSYSRQEVGELFVPFGTVLEIRIFPSTELYKGSGALVQMQSMEQAAAAIQALNGSFPRGATQPLLVRYADSPAEKAAKQARKERLMHKQATGAGLLGGNPLLAAQLQQQLLGLAINGGNNRSMTLPTSNSISSMGNSPDLSSDLTSTMLSPLDGYQDSTGSSGLPAAAVLAQQAAAAAAAAGPGNPGVGASIYIKGMPEDADKLWLYEKFARFGGISSVRVLIDEATGRCNGIGFVNYMTADAARQAQEAMNGVNMGDRLLHVMVQNPAARGRSAGGSANGMGPLAALPFGAAAGGGVAGLGPAARSQLAAMQTASHLGLHPSALACLQAGLMPASTSMSLQPVPMGMSADGMQQQGYGSGQPGGSFGALHW
ncbi:hypothetical protein ABPG75_006214 [Micractinium tetrahymenae]